MSSENTNVDFLDREGLKQYVQEHMPEMNDYSILMDGDLEHIVDALIELEENYIGSITPNGSGELEYDDDAAFNSISCELKRLFPQYETFCEAMTNDYMDLSEKFLPESGDIEWE